MNVIQETCRVHLIRYLRIYYYHWIQTSAGRLLVSEGFIRPIVTKLTIYVFIS